MKTHAAILAAAVAKVATMIPWLDLSSIDAVAIAAAVAGTLVSIIVGTLNGLTTKLLKQGTAEMQATLNRVLKLPVVQADPLSVDGVAGVISNNGARSIVNTVLELLGKKP